MRVSQRTDQVLHVLWSVHLTRQQLPGTWMIKRKLCRMQGLTFEIADFRQTGEALGQNGSASSIDRVT